MYYFGFLLINLKFFILNNIAKVGYGDLLNGEITLSAVQDVFSLPDTVYSQPQPSGWQSPFEPPLPIIHQRVIQAPKEILEQHIGFDNPDAVYLMTLAARPNKGALSYQVETRLGNEPFEVGLKGILFTQLSLLEEDISLEEVVLKVESHDHIMNNGCIVLIESEWSRVSIINGKIQLIDRGIFGSEAVNHAKGQLIWYVFEDTFGMLINEYMIGDSLDIRFSSEGNNTAVPSGEIPIIITSS